MLKAVYNKSRFYRHPQRDLSYPKKNKQCDGLYGDDLSDLYCNTL